MTVGRITFPALKMLQPIGPFFIGVMKSSDLVHVSVADVRRLHDNEIDTYIGIQRRLSPARSKELKEYVNSFDATFPTSVILAVNQENAIWDDHAKTLTFIESADVPLTEVARIIDGQHRVDGLTSFSGEHFDVNVSIFVGADIATQANIFATVNLAQTKVNRSLAYDLLGYESTRSPQKSAHHITVALDRIPYSPFFERIKRLGSATSGRENETITQAALVESILDMTSRDPMSDRNSIFKRLLLPAPSDAENKRFPFRKMFIEQKESDITQILLNYFTAVRERWPDSWENLDRKGNVLPKTNGIKALMRFLKILYFIAANESNKYIPEKHEFLAYLNKVELEDSDFTTDVFKPGTSGEALLFAKLSTSLDAQSSPQQRTLF